MRHFALPVLLLAALPAAAQDRSLWELIHPDRLAASMIRSGVLALRSQMDVRYSSLTVSAAAGAVSIDDLEIALYDNITGGEVCDVSIGGLELLTGDPFDADRVELSAAARAVSLSPGCLPEDMGPAAMLLGPDGMVLPEITADLSYDVPSASARMRVETALESVIAAVLELDFDYVTLWAGHSDAPEPSGDLASASLSLENLGGWERGRSFLPPPFTDPQTAGAAMTQALSGMLEAQAEGGVLPKPAKEFVTRAAQGWAAFVAEPGRLVIETGFPPSEPRFLDPGVIEEGPFPLIQELQPTVGQAPAAERNVLPPELVAQALSRPEALSEAARREVGMALLTGTGAPRAVRRGADLLADLEAPDGEVLVAVAKALAPSQPEVAYSAALRAGAAADAPGLRAVLDAIERDLPFGTRLAMQDAVTPMPSADALSGPTREVARLAAAHLSGVGAPRSLRAAVVHASVAAARGHGGAARLLERIDRGIREADRAAWSPVADAAAEAALAYWAGEAR